MRVLSFVAGLLLGVVVGVLSSLVFVYHDDRGLIQFCPVD